MENAVLSRPKAVLFDWDGTLVDSFSFLHAAHNYAQEQLGLRLMPIEEFAQYFGQPREKLYVEMYGEKGAEAKAHFETYVFGNHLDGLKPVPGAQALLGTLRALSIPCGVVSNKRRVLIEAEIENFGWGDFFQIVVGAGDAHEDKPSAAPFFHAVEKAGFTHAPSEIWLVGDTENDLLCANRAGGVAVLVAPECEARDLLNNHKVDLYKNNCDALNEFLLQYQGEPLKH